MNRESEQYRFARIEGYRITLARLEEQFKDRAVNLEEMEAAVAEQLAKENSMRTVAHVGNRARRLPRRHAACRSSVPFAISGGDAKSQVKPPGLGDVSTVYGGQSARSASSAAQARQRTSDSSLSSKCHKSLPPRRATGSAQ